MPIRRELRRLYPRNWKEISRRIRFERARGACESCGARHGHFRLRGPDITEQILAEFELQERLEDLQMFGLLEGAKISKIILTTAHLDHDPRNNDEANLKALCQRCHLSHDLAHHLKSRVVNAKKAVERQGQLRLFNR